MEFSNSGKYFVSIISLSVFTIGGFLQSMYIPKTNQGEKSYVNKPLVSILIPVYNRKKLVKRAIESATKQTYENIEIIIVDNKSTDKTYEILKEYEKDFSNIKIYQNKENIGPLKNWKKCLEYSSGEYIKILFSDDWIEETFVEKCMNILISHTDVGFVFTATLIHYKDKEKISYKFSDKKELYNTNIFIKGALCGNNFPVSPSSALFRRLDVENNLILEIPNKLNLNFSKLGAGNDLLLFLFTASKYSLFGFIPETLSNFGAQADSITISNDLSLQYMTAKDYFVDNFIQDHNLRDTFYSKLWLINIKNKGKYKQLVHINEVSFLKVLEILVNYFYKKMKNLFNIKLF